MIALRFCALWDMEGMRYFLEGPLHDTSTAHASRSDVLKYNNVNKVFLR